MPTQKTRTKRSFIKINNNKEDKKNKREERRRKEEEGGCKKEKKKKDGGSKRGGGVSFSLLFDRSRRPKHSLFYKHTCHPLYSSPHVP